MAEDMLVLVDEDDQFVGLAGKTEVHRLGLTHRAVSGFIFSPRGELLIQRRASCKYHSPGLWANTCCSHPRPGEAPLTCMERRLREEMGLTAAMQPFGTLRYRAPVGNGMTESEFVHGFAGRPLSAVTINPDEVEDHAWIKIDLLKLLSPASLAPWLNIYLDRGFVDRAWAAVN